MIVGITGPIASGKSVLAEMLAERGFIRLTLSEEVREEAKVRGIPIERTALQNLGNEMRNAHGKGYWAARLLAKMQKGKNYVVEGIRNPGEVNELRKERNFILIGVTAPDEMRLQWILKRNKDSDPKNLEDIRIIDARDRGKGEASHGQQSEACFAIADAYIINNTTLDDLRLKAAELVEQLGC
jgi:dephospho-CoA kinase